MPTLPTTRKEIEQALRAAIVARLTPITNIGNVHNRDRMPSEDEDDIALVTEPDEETQEPSVRVCMVQPLGFPNTTDNTDQKVLVPFRFSIKVVHEFVDKRADNSNSTDEFIGVICDIADSLDTFRSLGYDNSEVWCPQPLQQQGEPTFLYDEQSGIGAHSVMLLLTAEVRIKTL
jgi:hypothetical protein